MIIRKECAKCWKYFQDNMISGIPTSWFRVGKINHLWDLETLYSHLINSCCTSDKPQLSSNPPLSFSLGWKWVYGGAASACLRKSPALFLVAGWPWTSHLTSGCFLAPSLCAQCLDWIVLCICSSPCNVQFISSALGCISVKDCNLFVVCLLVFGFSMDTY
jgi:hypothetical protein